MFDNNASAAAATVDFLNLIDWTFADWLSAIFQLNISNDLNSIKSFLSVWILVVIFWACCFKRRARCKLCKRNIVASAFRSCWLRKLLISSVCCVLKFVSSSAIWWRDFLICNSDIFTDIFDLSQRFDIRWRIKVNVCCKLMFDA